MRRPWLSDWALQRKLIIVCKKEDDNLDLLTDVLTQQYPDLATKRFLLIDDEADLASVGYNRTDSGIDANVIPTQLNDLRAALSAASLLQVTATPYAIFLQPDGIVIPATQQAFEPIRPAFKKLIKPHAAYIGGEFYFEYSKIAGHVASFLHSPVNPNELVVLRQQNSLQLDLLQVLTSPSLDSLRRAIVTFIVGGTLRRWQQHEAGQPHRRYSFLVHIEVNKAVHNWQEEIVRAIVNRLRQDANAGMAVSTPLVQAAYDDLSQSITAACTQLPSLADVIAQFPSALGGIAIQTVNDENDVPSLLEANVQLDLRDPLNIFIGGNILDRGITIDNVIGFYDGRNPQRSQQDTVLQHSRMYGAREPHDLGVTRF